MLYEVITNVDLWVANKVDEKLKPKSNHQEWMFRMTRMTRERMTEAQLECVITSYSIHYTKLYEVSSPWAIPRRVANARRAAVSSDSKCA